MIQEPSDPKLMAVELLQMSPEEVFAKCRELNIPVTGEKLKMIDKIIVSVFGLDACKQAFGRKL
jgi:hypothetical protein